MQRFTVNLMISLSCFGGPKFPLRKCSRLANLFTLAYVCTRFDSDFKLIEYKSAALRAIGAQFIEMLWREQPPSPEPEGVMWAP